MNQTPENQDRNPLFRACEVVEINLTTGQLKAEPATERQLEEAHAEIQILLKEREQLHANVAELNERMTTEVKSYLASMEKLRAENNKLRSNPAFILHSPAPFMEMNLGPVDGYTDEQIQDAIDAAFPFAEGARYNCLDVLPTSIHWRYESTYRLAIARAFLARLAEYAKPAEAECGQGADNDSEFEDFERGITKEGAQ